MPLAKPVSPLQLPLFRVFATKVLRMSIEEAHRYDQRPFRSLLARGWVEWSPGRGFHITSAGRDAWDAFHHTSILRTDPSRPLTRYFDLAAHGISDSYREPKRRRLEAVPKAGAA